MGDSPPLVALITLGPTLHLVFLTIDLQFFWSFLLLLDLPTVLRLQLLLLLLLICFLILLLHLCVYVFFEACKLLGLRIVAYG